MVNNAKSLKELKDKKYIIYGGYVGTNVMDMESSGQKIFLESTEIMPNKCLKLNCITAEGSKVNKYIRSGNKELLGNIQNTLKGMKGKPMNKILYGKNIICES